MQIVKWQDQERVDQNDMEAMGDLLAGEFRRLFRATILGEEDETGIIRGFKVEPQAAPDATVRIRLDPGGGSPVGVAVLGENDTAAITYGQLAGERGAQAVLEGNATYTLDFSLDANDTYYVEVSFLYADGETDNRAYWNDSSNVEYIASNPTRRLPTLTFHKVTAPAGGEWTTLATVVWGGATITAGNITDQRRMLFEGAAPNYQTTQSGTGGIEDFTRAVPRADNTTDTIYSVLRKIGRQIQDIKGPNESGQWDFFSRAIKPMDPTALLPAGTTKSLASLDSLEYTVGDGTTAWGDFNGATGLQACLTHIGSAQASLPQRIRIRLKSRRTAISATAIWTCTAPLTLTTTKHIEIVGDTSGTEQDNGRVPVAFTQTGAMFNFNASTAGSLKLINILSANVPTSGIFAGVSSRLFLDNTLLCAANGVFVVRSNSTTLVWKNSEVYGAIQLAGDTVYQDVDSLTMINCRFGARTLYATDIDGHFRFWSDGSTGDTLSASNRWLAQGTFLGCELIYSPNKLAATSTREGCIDMRGASEIVFSNCNFSFPNDSNGVLLGNIDTDSGQGSHRIQFDTCRFTGVSPSFATNHDVDAGYNTVDGTGWHISGVSLQSGTVTSTTIDGFVSDVMIRNCTWTAGPRIDAGCIKFKNGAVGITVDNCRFESFTTPVSAAYASSRKIYMISVVQDADYSSYNSGSVSIRGCKFGRMVYTGAAADAPSVRYVNLNRIRGAKVDNCQFDCSDLVGASNKATWSTVSFAGVRLSDAYDVTISDSQFYNFPSAGSGSAAIIIAGNVGGVANVPDSTFTVRGCYFENSTYGLRGVSTNLVVYCRFEGNLFDANADSSFEMFKADGAFGGISRLYIHNNSVANVPGAPWTVVRLGNVNIGAIVGNSFTGFGIVNIGSPPSDFFGWNDVPSQLNGRNSWT